MVYLMGIDVGTSNTKILIINDIGDVIAKASEEYTISVPHQGYAEQDPEWWWNAVKISIQKVLESSHVDPKDIEAIGITGQMHGTILLDKDLKPLRPVIIWADKRSLVQCEEFYKKMKKKKVLDIVCNPIMPGFMGPTLLWVKKNEQKILDKTFKVLLPKDYIRLKLTGFCATDVSDASATLLFNVKNRQWSHPLLSQLGFTADLFPEVFESIEVTGEVSSDEVGLPRGVPVVAGGGDSQVGAVGCGVIKEGLVSSNIGTGGQVFVTLDKPRVDPYYRIHTFCHAVPGKWCLQGAILSAGLSLRWFRDNLACFTKDEKDSSTVDLYNLLSKEAELAEPGCKGLVFLPYLLGERSPHMDPDARGGFFGITYEHNRAHMIRAVMEGVAYALRDCLEIFIELGVKPEKVIARGGGSRSQLWRQIQADIFNAHIIRTSVEEEASFGAALLAGVGSGVYHTLEEACKKTVQVTSSKSPEEVKVKLYERYYNEVFRQLYPSLRDLWSRKGTKGD